MQVQMVGTMSHTVTWHKRTLLVFTLGKKQILQAQKLGARENANTTTQKMKCESVGP